MALIKCPECKKKISSQCGNCPNCGFPIKMNIDELSAKQVENKQHLYKKSLFWVAVVLIVVAILAFLFLAFSNLETKPKVNDDGSPKFIELTNEVYTNANDYLGYYIDIKGKVFQVMSDNGIVKGIQVWLDPDSCEQNIMIYYDTATEVKHGDYISCTGYIKSITEYKNAYDAKLYVPTVYSKDLIVSTYIDVMRPTIDIINFDELKYEKFGYSISIEKIEFSDVETRVYANVTNNGKSALYVNDPVIVQNGKQYNSSSNYEANYTEIPYEVVKGASCSGLIVFPAIDNTDFKLKINLHSDNYDEEFDEFTFKIGENNSLIEIIEETTQPKPKTTKAPKKAYPSAIGTYTKSNEVLYIYNDGTLYWEDSVYSKDPESHNYIMPLEGTWSQSGETICYSVWNIDGFVWNNPFYDTVYTNGVDFLGDYYTRN